MKQPKVKLLLKSNSDELICKITSVHWYSNKIWKIGVDYWFDGNESLILIDEQFNGVFVNQYKNIIGTLIEND
jgi:hypothetical protein